jgi:phage baseplate assembly protein W
MATKNIFYDPTEEQWPELKHGRIVLMPARVGMDRTTGKMLIGWSHVVQSIQVIFATRFHERVLRRWCGSFVPHLLGESAVNRVIARFYWAIATAIDLWEPNYRIQRINIGKSKEGVALTSVEALRLGHITTQNEGVYRPRAHVGDDTPESRRMLGLVSNGGVWSRG